MPAGKDLGEHVLSRCSECDRAMVVTDSVRRRRVGGGGSCRACFQAKRAWNHYERYRASLQRMNDADGAGDEQLCARHRAIAHAHHAKYVAASLRIVAASAATRRAVERFRKAQHA